MSEEATLDDFAEEQRDGDNEAIEAVPESSVESSLDETSVGKIPEGWIATRLGDIAEETEYGLTESAEDYDPDKPRYIRTQDFDDFGGLKEDSRASLSREKAKDGMLEEGDMLFARSGSVGASLGKTYLYDLDDGDCCFGGYSIRHQLQDAGLNHKYISEYTLSDRYWDWVRRRAKTTAQSNINTGEYGSLLLPIPPLPEQRKIATVLYTVDRAIEKTKQTIVQMEVVQEGLLRSLFGKESQKQNPDIETKTERLGPKQFQVPVTWEITEIYSIGRIVTGNTPSTDDESNFGGTLPFVTPATLSQGKYVTDSSRTLSEAGRDEAKPIPEGSVMMDCIGSDMGKVAVAGCEVATNQQINSVVIEDESYLPEFLYYHLQVLSDFIKSQAGQTATPIVNKSSFESFAIFNPPVEEQQEIVDTLSLYDEGRQSNIEYLAELKRLKRGLMQNLFSGTVRTTDTNIEVPEEITQYG